MVSGAFKWIIMFCLSGALLSGCATKSYVTSLENRLATAEREIEALKEGKKYVSRVSPVPSGWKGSWIALPTGVEESSAILIEKQVPEQVSVRVPYTYRILVTNLTKGQLSNVVVADVVDEGFQMTQADPPVTARDGRQLRWVLPALEPNAMKEIKISGTATRAGTIGYCASGGFAQDFCLATLVVEPLLAISETGPANVIQCDEFLYDIKVSNPGTGALNNLTVTAELPEGLKASESSFKIARLEPKETKNLQMKMMAARTGTFTSKVRVTSQEGLTAESAPVTTVVAKPALAVNLKAADTLFIGNQMTYEGTVTNMGDAPAENVEAVLAMDSCSGFVSASDNGRAEGNSVLWGLGRLNPGQSKTVNVRVKALELCKAKASISAKGVCAPQVVNNIVTEYKGIPAILLEVIDTEDPVRVGTATDYIITATNQGSAPGTNISIVVNTEDSMQILEVGGATQGQVAGMTVTFAPLPSLPPGAKAEWKVSIKALKVSDARLKVTMNSDQLGRPVEETEATNLYQ